MKFNKYFVNDMELYANKPVKKLKVKHLKGVIEAKEMNFGEALGWFTLFLFVGMMIALI